ncbi:MAG: hypothetical protein IJW16_06640 [Clostridia bacterium]|nr:hypothetical protein [Clostridia bacterium]
MKKNIVGNMIAPKKAEKRILKRLDLVPRLLCLILALIVWLLVVNLHETKPENQTEDLAGITEVLP